MVLPFEPACLPLLLGALPHRSAAQALQVVRRHAGALLAWPQLPQRSFREHSLVQSAAGFPGLVVDVQHMHVYVDRSAAERAVDRLSLAYLENDVAYAALSADNAAGLAELLRQSDGLRGVLALKGQLLGPVSTAAMLVDDRQRPLIYDPALFESLAQHLYLRAAWQDQQLHDLADAVIICLDEPFLDVVGMPFLPLDWDQVRTQLETTLAGVSGCRALFAAGATDWAQLLQTSVELIIVDAYAYGHALIAAAPALPAFLERGGALGLGLVPADEELLAGASVEGLARRATALLHQLASADFPADQIARRSVITTSSTLGALSMAGAERALGLLAGLSRHLREQYSLV
jgi:hypothetical protein